MAQSPGYKDAWGFQAYRQLRIPPTRPVSSEELPSLRRGPDRPHLRHKGAPLSSLHLLNLHANSGLCCPELSGRRGWRH